MKYICLIFILSLTMKNILCDVKPLEVKEKVARCTYDNCHKRCLEKNFINSTCISTEIKSTDNVSSSICNCFNKKKEEKI